MEVSFSTNARARGPVTWIDALNFDVHDEAWDGSLARRSLARCRGPKSRRVNHVGPTFPA